MVARDAGCPSSQESRRPGAGGFAAAAAEWLRYIEHDRARKPNTVVGYAAVVRAHLLPAFGERRLETITPEDVERWLRSLDRAPTTRGKALVCMHGIFRRAQRVWGVVSNPAAEVDRPTLAADR